MAEKEIVVCDVDNVVVDLSDDWIAWINKHLPEGSQKLSREHVEGVYDFAQEVAGKLPWKRVHSFWKQYSLYDGATPIPGSVNALWRLKHKYNFDIVFASHVEGFHANSKYKFLKKYFPVDGFVATREKEYVRANIIIDDRNEVLDRIPMSVYAVKKITPWCKDDTIEVDYVFKDWSDEAVDQLIADYRGEKVEVEVEEFDYDEFTYYTFSPPSRFYIRNAFGNYVFLKTTLRSKAQEYVDLTYGKGKYTVNELYHTSSKGKETAK